MKKLMVLVITGVLMFNLAGPVLAVEEDGNLLKPTNSKLELQEEKRAEREQRLEERQAEKAARLETRQEFADELDQLNTLQRENLSLRIDINSAHQQIRNLLLAAPDHENQEAVQAVREVRQELSGVNQELRDLQAQLKEERQEFRDALKNDLIPEAQSHMANMLQTKESINAKLRIKIDLLQRIITILS